LKLGRELKRREKTGTFGKPLYNITLTRKSFKKNLLNRAKPNHDSQQILLYTLLS